MSTLKMKSDKRFASIFATVVIRMIVLRLFFFGKGLKLVFSARIVCW